MLIHTISKIEVFMMLPDNSRECQCKSTVKLTRRYCQCCFLLVFYFPVAEFRIYGSTKWWFVIEAIGAHLQDAVSRCSVSLDFLCCNSCVYSPRVLRAARFDGAGDGTWGVMSQQWCRVKWSPAGRSGFESRNGCWLTIRFAGYEVMAGAVLALKIHAISKRQWSMLMKHEPNPETQDRTRWCKDRQAACGVLSRNTMMAGKWAQPWIKESEETKCFVLRKESRQ